MPLPCTGRPHASLGAGGGPCAINSRGSLTESFASGPPGSASHRRPSGSACRSGPGPKKPSDRIDGAATLSSPYRSPPTLPGAPPSRIPSSLAASATMETRPVSPSPVTMPPFGDLKPGSSASLAMTRPVSKGLSPTRRGSVVAGQRDALPAGLGRQLRRGSHLRRIPPGHEDGRAGLCQTDGDTLADAPAGTGDHRESPSQVPQHPAPSSPLLCRGRRCS
mmetsp:Transcript_24906/g.83058  ORF Transcript_24906/g.83058 Transcript_24906/m.83058 type:complete len:221 (-) Transcript_24906:111-773(-)